MRSALAYRPRRGRLQRIGAPAAVLYLGGFLVAAFALSNPVALAGLGVAVVACGSVAGAGRAMRAMAWVAIPVALIYTLLTALFTQRGETVLVRGWELSWPGRLDVTLEGLVAGGVIGMRIAIVILAFAVWSACVDPDRVLRALRPFAARSALTATLLARLAPVAARDAAGLREAARLRGPAAAPVGRAALLRRLVGGALDRAVDVAATLELRGYGLQADRPSFGLRRRSPHDGRFAATGVLVAALALVAPAFGFAGFDPYPALAVDTGPGTLALAAALPLLALAPFGPEALPRRRATGPLRPAPARA